MSSTVSIPDFDNVACYLDQAGQNPYAVRPAPHPTPAPNEITIRTAAVAFNPADAAQQDAGLLIPHYPWVPGFDAAGTVLSVGSAVGTGGTNSNVNFAPGDRVLVCADSVEAKKASNGAFQLHFASAARLAVRIPDHVSFREACVLPVAMCTAAMGLYQRHGLALPLPSAPRGGGNESKAVLVWGVASSVGSCALQLSRGSGFNVVAVASGKNAQYCKDLGADVVCDYKSPSVIEDVVKAIRGHAWEFAGAFNAIFTAETVVACSKIAQALGGRQHVATVYPPGFPMAEGLADGVEASDTNCLDMPEEITTAVLGIWMPKALDDGDLVCKPEPLVIGKGVEGIQKGTTRVKEGVSARKVVVEL